MKTTVVRDEIGTVTVLTPEAAKALGVEHGVTTPARIVVEQAMTDPLVERARAWLGQREPDFNDAYDLMAAFARDVVEECSKAVCERCLADVPLIVWRGEPTHHRLAGSAYWPCTAAPIRKLFLEAHNGS